MAVVVRCSSVLNRPTSTTLSRRSGNISDHTHVSGIQASLLVNVRGLVSLRDDCCRIFKKRSALRGIFSMHQKPGSPWTSQVSEIDQTYSKALNERFSSHQTMGLVSSLPMGLMVTNALLLVAPFEALAETCEAEQSILNMNMPLLLLVALIGATVGGLLARQRKGELQRLNEQLRQINAALKRQAKIESYAPALSYAPVGARIPEDEVIVDPRKQELISRLKNGKNFLRNQDPDKAFYEFKTALELAQNLKDPIEEKKAARGLGASLQRQGKYREAINYHSLVLSISEREGEESGNTEAYGAIADCYTELGDLEKAATFYDEYIARLQSD